MPFDSQKSNFGVKYAIQVFKKNWAGLYTVFTSHKINIHTYIYDGIKGGVLMELSTYIKMERNKKKRGKVEIWSIE